MLPTNQPFHSSITAAVLLLGKELAGPWDWPTTENILERTGASKSQAYAMATRLRTLLGTLMGRPGRPTVEPAPERSLLLVSRCIQDYLMRHPGAASVENYRYGYSDGFRRFIVGPSKFGSFVRRVGISSSIWWAAAISSRSTGVRGRHEIDHHGRHG